MKVEMIGPEQQETYERYVLSFEGSLLYYSTKYKHLLKYLLGCSEEYLVSYSGDEINGVLPLLYSEKNGRRIYNSLPYFSGNGGVLSDSEEAYEELIGAYSEIARTDTTISSTIVGNPFVRQPTNHIPYTFKYRRIIQYTDLSEKDMNEERLMVRMDSSTRRNVKKAKAAGLAVGIDFNEMDRLRDLHQENMKTVGGLPKTDKFFSLVKEIFEPGHEYAIYVARKDDVVIAALLVFYYNKTVEYFTPAIDPEFRSIQPLSAILMNAMADAARRGYTRWNWGGTGESQIGVYRFKKKWGASEIENEYYVYLNDRDVLSWSRGKILNDHPNFFVVPFSKIEANKNE